MPAARYFRWHSPWVGEQGSGPLCLPSEADLTPWRGLRVLPALFRMGAFRRASSRHSTEEEERKIFVQHRSVVQVLLTRSKKRSIHNAILPAGAERQNMTLNIYEANPNPVRRRQEDKRPRHSDGRAHPRSRHKWRRQCG